jgi:hypothetical protein
MTIDAINNLSIANWIGIGGFIMGALSLIITFNKERKNKPIIKFYGKPIWNLVPAECQRELTIGVKNKGNKDALLKEISIELKKGYLGYIADVVYPNTKKISAGDCEELTIGVNLPRKFDLDDFKKNKLPFKAKVIFDFSHKRIRKIFWIGKSNKLKSWISLKKHIFIDHYLKPFLRKFER